MKKLIFTIIGGLLLTGSASADIVVAGGGSNFGATAGVGVQFDASPVGAGATGNIAVTELVDGGTFSVDSLTLNAVGNTQRTNTTPFFLGVYNSIGPADGTDGTIVPLSGFQGVSSNSVIFNDLDALQAFTFSFSDILVTANADLADLSDELFFVFQDSQEAITALPAIANNTTGIDRLANGADVDSRVQIIQVPNALGVVLRADRAPRINVSVSQVLTAIPEPSSLALVCLSGVFAVARRRRS